METETTPQAPNPVNLVQQPQPAAPYTQAAVDPGKPVKQQRINNLTFVTFWLLTNLIFAVSIFVFILIAGELSNGGSGLLLIGDLVTLLISLYFLALFLRSHVYRLWDANHPEWWILLLFIPVVNTVFTLYLMIVKSYPEANKHGNVAPPGVHMKRIFRTLRA